MPRIRAIKLSCDQCEMLSINGVACHERGCPNMGARFDAQEARWIKQRECFTCGFMVDRDDPCCDAPFDDSDDSNCEVE